MAFAQSLRENKDTLLRGATLIVGGMALVLAGSLIGISRAKAAQLTAGTLGVGGVVTMFLGFFLYILPPLLPKN